MTTSPADHLSRAQEIVASLTLPQKASLVTGADFWRTVGIPEAGIEPVMVSDGPHGIRKQVEGGDALGLNESVVAVCFPPAVAMAATFDPELSEQVGDALGQACLAEKVGVLLGPGINMKRSPLGGRNFEYYSEDPFLAGVMAAAYVRGVQKHGVGTSLKHFAANNQETERFRISADIDPRPLHEIYLRAFEYVVRTAAPWTLMAAYNKINGTYATEDRWLLTETLREKWGFAGLVVSDWGAVDDRVAAVAAGLDLEMPGNAHGPAAVEAAVSGGSLPEAALDECAAHVVALSLAASANAVDTSYDHDLQHRLAAAVARRCIVLLRNEPIDGHPVLPLAPSTSVAVIGEFARTPRYQGGGSSKVNPTQVDSGLDAITAHAEADVAFEPGFTIDGTADPALIARATDAARSAEVAVVFLGVPAGDESEGFDRTDWRLPQVQLDLLAAVLEANPRTVVVLSHGSVVDLAEVVAAPAVLDGLLLGEGGGSAIGDVLYGREDPSGRLAETIPLRLADNPAHLNFPGENLHVRYGEGIFIGYRGYDAREMDVRFPFGHGLSYTTMTFTDVAAAVTPDGVDVEVTVTNTGSRDGRAVVQVYLGKPDSIVARPPRELKGIAAVALSPGEQQRVSITISRGELAYWDSRTDGWVVEGGDYRIDVGYSSRDIAGSVTVAVEGDESSQPLSLDSTVAELLAVPSGRAVILGQMERALGLTEIPETLEQLIGAIPLRRVAPMLGLDTDDLQAALTGA